MSKTEKYLICLSALFAVIYLVLIPYTTVPWCDEIGKTDTSVNILKCGQWASHVWKYSYNPLHAFLLIPWLSVFGINHMSVCGFSVLWGGLAIVLIVLTAYRRRLIPTLLDGSILTALLWSNWVLISIIPNGRIDTLSLFLTVLWVNEVFSFQKDRKGQNVIRMFCLSFLLMFANVYAIPLLILFLIYIIFFFHEGKQTFWKKSIVCITGFVVSFVSICIFYACVQQLIGYLNTYISFNGTLNPSTELSFVQRLIQAYTMDYHSLVLLVISSVVIILKRKKELYLYLIFISAIPLLMVIAGRYASYYGWLFAIPVCVLFFTSCINALNVTNKKILLVVLFVLGGYRMAERSMENSKLISISNQINRVVESHGQKLESKKNVVFINEICYYPLRELDCDVWYRKLKDTPSPDEKFEVFINNKIKNPQLKNKVRRLYHSLQNNLSYMPESGYLICTSEYERNSSISYLNSHKYSCISEIVQDEISLIEFERTE